MRQNRRLRSRATASTKTFRGQSRYRPASRPKISPSCLPSNFERRPTVTAQQAVAADERHTLSPARGLMPRRRGPGDTTVRTRKLSYELCRLSGGLGSLDRLVMVNAIEATGAVTIQALGRVGAEMESCLDRRLVFFGSRHLESERDHTLSDDAIRSALEDVRLDTASAPRSSGSSIACSGTFAAFRRIRSTPRKGASALPGRSGEARRAQGLRAD
jgi:hypothetical protein